MPRSILGLSTTYFAIRGKNIYDSVRAVREMGFDCAELGAAHPYEASVQDTLRRIKRDFGDMRFTLHGLFPPLSKPEWFNMSLGLTTENRRIIGAFFSAASAVEADVVGVHPGYPVQVKHRGAKASFRSPILGTEIPIKGAIEKSKESIAYALELSEDSGIALAVENAGLGNAAEPLFLLPENIGILLSSFPELGLLLDFGHALYMRKLDEMLEFSERVVEMHMHYSNPAAQGIPTDEHLPLSKEFPFEKLSTVRQIKKIPLIFEHGTNVSEQEVLAEKSMLEKFLSGL